jgi:hypothetical protein
VPERRERSGANVVDGHVEAAVHEGEAEGITSEAVVRSILDEVSPPAVE